jgi:hypothetical protein
MMDGDPTESVSFKAADAKIAKLIDRLLAQNHCPDCIARALAYHAAGLAANSMGSSDAAVMFEEIADNVRENNIPAPERAPSTAAH